MSLFALATPPFSGGYTLVYTFQNVAKRVRQDLVSVKKVDVSSWVGHVH